MPELVDHGLRVLARRLGLLPHERLDVVVGDLERELVRRRLQRELARDRLRRLAAHRLGQLLRRPAGDLEIRLGGNPTLLERAHEAGQELTGARLDERPGRIHVRCPHERVDRVGAEGILDLHLQLLAEPRLDVGAQVGQRVELARRARELVVELGQHLLLDLLDRDLDRSRGPVRQLVADLLRLALRGSPQRRLDLLHEPAAAELDHGVALLAAVGRDEVEHERVAVARGAPLGGDQLRNGLAQRLELLLDELGRHLRLGPRHLEPDPVHDLDLRLHGHRRDEVPFGIVGARQLVVVLGLRDRPDARPGSRVPEPAGDVAVDGLGVDALLAEPLDEDRRRHLARPEAGDLDGARQVGGRMLDRVVHVVRRNVHREANAILAELFDPCRHQAIQAEVCRAGPQAGALGLAGCGCSFSSVTASRR